MASNHPVSTGQSRLRGAEYQDNYSEIEWLVYGFGFGRKFLMLKASPDRKIYKDHIKISNISSSHTNTKG